MWNIEYVKELKPKLEPAAFVAERDIFEE